MTRLGQLPDGMDRTGHAVSTPPRFYLSREMGSVKLLALIYLGCVAGPSCSSCGSFAHSRPVRADDARLPVVSSACSAGTGGAASWDLPGRVEPGRRHTRLEGARWNTHLGCAHRRQLVALPFTGAPGHAAVWSPDGRQVLTESGLGPEVWNASSGPASCARCRRAYAPSADLEFSRDGSQLAGTAIDERGYGIRIWDWPEGVETLRLRDSGLRVALSPDARLIATVRWRQPVPSCAFGRSSPSSCSRSRGAASPAR